MKIQVSELFVILDVDVKMDQKCMHLQPDSYLLDCSKLRYYI